MVTTVIKAKKISYFIYIYIDLQYRMEVEILQYHIVYPNRDAKGKKR
jgi:hypothetical protein